MEASWKTEWSRLTQVMENSVEFDLIVSTLVCRTWSKVSLISSNLWMSSSSISARWGKNKTSALLFLVCKHDDTWPNRTEPLTLKYCLYIREYFFLVKLTFPTSRWAPLHLARPSCTQPQKKKERSCGGGGGGGGGGGVWAGDGEGIDRSSDEQHAASTQAN